ncbi:MAG: ATP-dependent RecD-like DNA helicase, partial [Clostridiales bacterium]|nr:ATP-dependent RecD-like DNA helicase [Clostridiales bacterium]
EPYRVQVLCPIKAGAAGASNLNRRLQRKLNESGGAFVESEGCRYITGDKVMHITNNYNLGWRRIVGGTHETGEGVFNGDLGVIAEIRPDSGEIDVLYEDGRLVTYTPDVRNQLMPAYAITVHKSQGSEFDGVIVPLYGLNPVIMTRNLLYTAITRAKRAVVLVGERYTIKRMVENDYVALRYSALKKFLGEAFVLDSLLFGSDEEDDE